uniref:Dedicator of cytokinesis protein 5 n=1 Tax=Cacopsylla melanoneura TaxID=428564 RepID=A0A8D9A3P4_9HEMI
MTNHWIPYREKFKQGIAKYNFIGHAPTSPKLTLTVGQKVTLLARSTDGQWYYGETVYRFGIETVTRNPNNPPVDRRGIFPCSYIHDLRKSDSKEMSIVDEITCVLREWHMLWKTLYLRNRTEFNSLSKKMEELIDLRGKIVSQKLPLDELKSVKSSASTTMDVGNKTLGLDLVVRDEHSNLLKPKDVSTPNMYKMHEEANERIRVSLKANSRPISSVSDTYHSMCHSIGKLLS